jgi:adenylate cyclase
VERKLTAILCADVHGYSRLMGADEEATVGTLNDYRGIIDSLIVQHHGRFFGSAGDSVIAEFASVVEAAQCAVDIQASLKVKNADLPAGRRMEFRIGVNLGDVIVQGDQLYGDGVNIAARLENLAEPGGIVISASVHEQIWNKLALSYTDLGPQRVKNIAQLVRAFRVTATSVSKNGPRIKHLRIAGISVATLIIIGAAVVVVQHLSLRPPNTSASIPAPLRPALTLPDKPSIAVLPFANLSGHPEQDYFSDGITDDLINHLSRIPSLFVIARNSSFTYKNKPARVQDIGRQLGVRYVLEGSVQKTANQVRIAAQLADAEDGTELWAQSYDRPLRDIFNTQDEIVQRIVATLRLQVTNLQRGLPAASMPHGTDNVEAYDYWLRATAPFFSGTKEGIAQSRAMAQRAIELDPKFSYAYAGIGSSYVLDVMSGYSASPARDLQRATQLAQKTLALDNSNPWGYYLLSSVSLVEGDDVQAADNARRGITLDPSGPFGYQRLADALISSGQLAQAIDALRQAIRLDPWGSGLYMGEVGWAYVAMRKYPDAITALKQHLVNFPNSGLAHLSLAIAYSETGQKDLARREVAEARRINPNLSVRTLSPNAWGDRALFARYVADLRQAGLN